MTQTSNATASPQKKDSGVVTIHGKQYQTVALRVGKFREKHPSHTLLTEIVSRDEEFVVMVAKILDESGRLIATGHSEEKRSASQINRTSALENAETSAIGRALAAFGLGGTEFATADEVANAIAQQNAPKSVARDAWDELSDEDKKFLQQIADETRAIGESEGWLAAFEHLKAQQLDPDERVAVWSRFDSKERAAMEPHKRPKKAA